MAITSLTVYQDNIEGSINAMAVHSPLVFLVDVEYTSTPPDNIYCEIVYGTTSLLTVRCIYSSDITATSRRFKFVADEILRTLMADFDDYVQTGGSFVVDPKISKEFQLVFKSDLPGTFTQSVYIDAIHAVRQIGENACLTDVAANPNDIWICGVNKPVYVYFYNLSGEPIPPTPTSYALDYDGAFFVDYNGDKFVIQ